LDTNRKLQGSDETEESFGDDAYRTRRIAEEAIRTACRKI
jgi:hypothetical protein